MSSSRKAGKGHADRRFPIIPPHIDGKCEFLGEVFDMKSTDVCGDTKVNSNGLLYGGRRYRCRTFTLSTDHTRHHPRQRFMHASECAHELGYEDWKQMFNDEANGHSLDFINILGEELWYMDGDILGPKIAGLTGNSNEPYAVSALTIFRQFGSRIIRDGRVVFDDYFEGIVRQQGFIDDTIWAAAMELEVDALEEFLISTSWANVDERDSCGRTPLSYATERGDLINMESLLSSATVTIFGEDNTGKSPFYYAVVSKRAEILDELLDSQLSQSWKAEAMRDLDGLVGKLCKRVSGHELLSRIVTQLCGRLSAKFRWLPRLTDHSLGLDSLFTFFYFQWEVPDAIETLMKSEHDSIESALMNYVTVTGWEETFICSKYSDYVKSEWPVIGETAISLVGEITVAVLWNRDRSYSSTGYVRSETLIWHYGVDRGGFTLRPTSPRHPALVLDSKGSTLETELQQMIDALAWICSAIRIQQKDNTYGTGDTALKLSIPFRASPKPYNNLPGYLSLLALENHAPLLTRAELSGPSCWTGLFDTVMVAEARLKKRQWGMGLEIPFKLLIQLAGIENWAPFRDGTILLGYFTALIPMAFNPITQEMQWHFYTQKDKCILPRHLEDVVGDDWFETCDVGLLEQGNCFVGWSGFANVLLGTQRLVLAQDLQVSWSQYRGTGSDSDMRSRLGTPRGISHATYEYRLPTTMLRRPPLEQFGEALNCSRNKTFLVIDSKAKQAWLVSWLSMLLHLCHVYIKRISVSCPPFAEESPFGDAAVISALEAEGDSIVIHGPEKVRMRTVFHRMMVSLSIQSNSRTLHDESAIFATELMDVVLHRDSEQKLIPLSESDGSWPDLLPFARAADDVGVCANIGQIIDPAPSLVKDGCQECRNDLPMGKYYLAAQMSCIASLCEKIGCDITDIEGGRCDITHDDAWEIENSPWPASDPAVHRHIWTDKIMTETILQRTFKNSYRSRPSIKPVMEKYPRKGVVVFGRSSRELDVANLDL